MRALGLISYTFYLVHLPLIFLIDRYVDLLAYHLGYGGAHPRCKSRVVVGLAGLLGLHHRQQIGWPGQTGHDSLALSQTVITKSKSISRYSSVDLLRAALASM